MKKELHSLCGVASCAHLSYLKKITMVFLCVLFTTVGFAQYSPNTNPTNDYHLEYGRTESFSTTGSIEIANLDARYEATGQNFGGRANYKIILGEDNILNQPVFFIDGFDPAQSRDIESIIEEMEKSEAGKRFKNTLSNWGFDLIIVDFPKYYNNGTEITGGADYIERNGLLLAELIKRVNYQKDKGDINPLTGKPNNPFTENVIIGPSMGGVDCSLCLELYGVQTGFRP